MCGDTDTNKDPTDNKGIKELRDIKKAIQHYRIGPDDFVVKLTGRYAILPKSPFMDALGRVAAGEPIEGIVRFGSFTGPAPSHKTADCMTGLIGMRAKHIASIAEPVGTSPIEWEWGKVAAAIPDVSLVMLPRLGIRAAIGGENPTEY